MRLTIPFGPYQLCLAISRRTISNKELMDAVIAKMAEICDAQAIKKVRGQFVPLPLGIRDIPQAKRWEFLKKLAALAPPPE